MSPISCVTKKLAKKIYLNNLVESSKEWFSCVHNYPSINYVLLWIMARMEMDCNLKKLAIVFKFFLFIIFREVAKIIVCSSSEKSLNIFFLVL